ncbi:MAG: ABC transporter substrate-binding protein [Alphaproteobacteria bacterium]|nr:ABC transporter substrate-binding protein [Alphaproteobacteria bacterium]
MTILKNIQNTLKLSTFILSFLYAPGALAHKTIGITQIVDHPSLNDIRKGIIEELAQAGYREGKNLTIIFENAQGNPSTASQIAHKFQSLPLDAIVPISTPSAQAMVQQVKNTPIIFAAISDPLEAKIVSSLEHPAGNVTGVADTPPVEEQLDFIMQCLPNLKVLGFLYNPGEVNNVIFLKHLERAAKEKNIKILKASASKTADIQAAVNSIIEDIDALFIGNDNTIVSGLEAVIKASLKAKKPFFVSDPDSVNRGALAAYAYDQRKIGQQVGRMVLEILNGKNPGDLSVEKPQDLRTYINPRTASLLNIHCSAIKSNQEAP